MGKREAFALIAIPLLVATVVWLPSWVFLALLAAAVVVAADELLAMARGSGVAVGRWIPLALVVGILVSSWRWGLAGTAIASIAAVIIIPAARRLSIPATRRAR